MKYIKKYKYIVFLIIFLFIIIFFSVIKFNLKKNNLDIKNNINNNVFSIQEEIPHIDKIKVDIKGAVVTPGVYELDNGNRVIDVINLAGGLFEYSDTSLINLSKKLTDEMVIIIYTKDEITNSKQKDTVYKIIDKECNCPKIENDSCINNFSSSSSLVNINTCTLEDLLAINGIGESKAKAIIEYRNQHGLFSKIEDILNVSGIGDSVFEKIKIYITV